MDVPSSSSMCRDHTAPYGASRHDLTDNRSDGQSISSSHAFEVRNTSGSGVNKMRSTSEFVPALPRAHDPTSATPTMSVRLLAQAIIKSSSDASGGTVGLCGLPLHLNVRRHDPSPSQRARR